MLLDQKSTKFRGPGVAEIVYVKQWWVSSTWGSGPTGQTNRHMDIATCRVNRPKGRFGQNYMFSFGGLPLTSWVLNPLLSAMLPAVRDQSGTTMSLQKCHCCQTKSVLNTWLLYTKICHTTAPVPAYSAQSQLLLLLCTYERPALRNSGLSAVLHCSVTVWCPTAHCNSAMLPERCYSAVPSAVLQCGSPLPTVTVLPERCYSAVQTAGNIRVTGL